MPAAATANGTADSSATRAGLWDAAVLAPPPCPLPAHPLPPLLLRSPPSMLAMSSGPQKMMPYMVAATSSHAPPR